MDKNIESEVRKKSLSGLSIIKISDKIKCFDSVNKSNSSVILTATFWQQTNI